MRCAYCRRSFAENERSITLTSTRLVPNRRSLGTLAEKAVSNHWHADCLATFEAENETSRKRDLAEMQAVLDGMKGAA